MHHREASVTSLESASTLVAGRTPAAIERSTGSPAGQPSPIVVSSQERPLAEVLQDASQDPPSNPKFFTSFEFDVNAKLPQPDESYVNVAGRTSIIWDKTKTDVEEFIAHCVTQAAGGQPLSEPSIAQLSLDLRSVPKAWTMYVKFRRPFVKGNLIPLPRSPGISPTFEAWLEKAHEVNDSELSAIVFKTSLAQSQKALA